MAATDQTVQNAFIEMLKELYKNSTPEERKTILKILGGGGGLVGFFWFLLRL